MSVVRTGVIVLCLALGFAALSGAGARPRASGPPQSVVRERDCRDRITGAFVRRGGRTVPYRFVVHRRHDTSIGPVAFAGAKDYGREVEWRRMVRDGQWLKSIALVRAGRRVTLEIPRGQRSWMQLEYGSSPYVALRGCRRRATRAARRRECGPGPQTSCRSKRTPFGGGFTIDYARAPRQGRCAELIVWVNGRERPLRKRLFRPQRGACG